MEKKSIKIEPIKVQDIDFDHYGGGKDVEEVEAIRSWTKKEYGEEYPTVYVLDEWIDMVIEKYNVHPSIVYAVDFGKILQTDIDYGNCIPLQVNKKTYIIYI